jgi:hypothetical protein
MGITLIVFHRKITKIAYHCKTKFSSFGCGQVDISSLRPEVNHFIIAAGMKIQNGGRLPWLFRV